MPDAVKNAQVGGRFYCALEFKTANICLVNSPTFSVTQTSRSRA
jgi:hypothetical protein